MTPERPVLRDVAAQARRNVGVALTTVHFSDRAYTENAGKYFDSLTPENHMKWDAVEPEPGRFSFGEADKLVLFAEQHGMRVRGHTLVWHHQLAPWVQSLSGSALHDAMIAHVRGTAEHFKGKIAQWDVVNEAIGDHGELRPNSPFTPLPNYIAESFRVAHETDPAALLFYNDYDIEEAGTPKAEAAYALVKQLKHDGVPIDGIGFQMHVDPRRWPSGEQIQRHLERFAALGLRIEITELDVPVGEIPGTLEHKLTEQARITHDIVKACLAVPACTGITFWGITDKYSWLNMPKYAGKFGAGPHFPLLFDDDYRTKPMYDAALAAFAGH